MVLPPNSQSVPGKSQQDGTTQICTKRGKILAQILFCEGCCCGRTDRGLPAFPKDWIKSIWKECKLNRHIQLTISGCLGPCDIPNVACIIGRDGQMTWLGHLTALSEYQTIVDWASDCQAAQRLLPLPGRLRISLTALQVARHN